MAKSLFQKGADFVSSMVFMFASTNLVIELGIVMLLLLGWQFTVAEFVGGPIMIALLALVGGVILRGPLVARARRRLQSGNMSHVHDHQAMVGVSEERQAELEREPWSKKLSSKADWADASSYAVADVTMLRKDLVIGYTVAGFLAVLVPTAWWSALFVHGHGFWTDLENALVGPLVAIISWVCSIGNVPLAAALWRGGISFGGVIAFIFADLIAMPLDPHIPQVLRRPLDAAHGLCLLPSHVGCRTGGSRMFSAARAVPPRPPTTRSLRPRFSWNYTSFLNIVFILWPPASTGCTGTVRSLGGGQGHTTDPVCGMQAKRSARSQ